jgi:hypothetical protein
MFAAELFYYWAAPLPDGFFPDSVVAQIYMDMAEQARALWEPDPSRLVSLLRVVAPYELFRLIFARERPELNIGVWRWLGPVLLAAARIDLTAMRPQIAFLVSDSTTRFGREGSGPSRVVQEVHLSDEKLGLFFEGTEQQKEVLECLAQTTDLSAMREEARYHVNSVQQEAAERLSRADSSGGVNE